jgi:hypothetical protein
MNNDLMGSYCGFSGGCLGDHRRATVTASEMQLSLHLSHLSHLSICFFVVSSANIVIPYYGGSFRIMYSIIIIICVSLIMASVRQ